MTDNKKKIIGNNIKRLEWILTGIKIKVKHSAVIMQTREWLKHVPFHFSLYKWAAEVSIIKAFKMLSVQVEISPLTSHRSFFSGSFKSCSKLFCIRIHFLHHPISNEVSHKVFSILSPNQLIFQTRPP